MSRLPALPLMLLACSASVGSEEEEPSATLASAGMGNGERPEPDARPVFTPGEAFSIIVPPDSSGAFPPDLWVRCPNGPQFQIADLLEIVPLEQGDPGGVAEAAQSFLDGGEGQYWPQRGWRILRHTEAEVLLVHRSAGALAFMSVLREDGSWVWDGAQTGSGGCPLQYVLPMGLNQVEWGLDPSAPPDPADDQLLLIATERECVSGQAMGDRLLSPQVVVTDSAVRVALAATPPPGNAFNCLGNPSTSLTVELPEPLGERQVLEGYSLGIELESYLP